MKQVYYIQSLHGFDGSRVAKALSPLQPTRFLFEKYDEKVRTGRVIFWSLKQDIPQQPFHQRNQGLHQEAETSSITPQGVMRK